MNLDTFIKLNRKEIDLRDPRCKNDDDRGHAILDSNTLLDWAESKGLVLTPPCPMCKKLTSKLHYFADAPEMGSMCHDCMSFQKRMGWVGWVLGIVFWIVVFGVLIAVAT